MECERLPSPQTWDDAEIQDVRRYRLHISFCSSCRSRVLREAPDQLLYAVREDPLPEEFWIGFWQSLRQKLNATPIKPSGPSYASVRWVAVIAFVVMIFLHGRDLPKTSTIRHIEPENYPVIEAIENPDAHYFIFQAGERQKIIMIYDPAMKL